VSVEAYYIANLTFSRLLQIGSNTLKLHHARSACCWMSNALF